MQPSVPTDSLLIGRALAKDQRLDEAETHFAQVLADDPGQPEAVAFVLRRAMARAEHASVIALAERAIGAGVQDPALFNALGHAHLFCGDQVAALSVLERSLDLDAKQFHLRLKVGKLHETAGNQQRALIAYFRALTDAQQQGHWKNDASTEPALRAAVKHAMDFIGDGRARLFRAALAPLRQAHGAAAVARIERCVATYLGEVRAAYDHPMQKPTFLHVPGLPSAGFYQRDLFPWMDELEANAATIREEALAVLAGDRLLEPFLGEGSDGVATGQLRNDRGKPAWDAFFFYRHGRRYDDNCARCPATTAVLERLPLVRIDEHAPEILFSVLTPGSHILPHTGVTNARLVGHLALIVPPDCAIRVGDETRQWEDGRGFVFDDTYEHEAWNLSGETRVVMILDVWNPHLTPVEREAFNDLVLAIWAFTRACDDAFDEGKLAELQIPKVAQRS